MPGTASPISLFWFTVGLALVFAFAWTRPLTLTDFENRKLARNVSAQVFFTLLYIVVFVVLTAAFQYGGRLFATIVDGAGWLGSMSHYVQRKSDQPASFAPLLALGAIGWFQSLPVLREVERTCLVYTYSARYMFSDVLELTHHLQACTFEPTDSERSRNRQVLERLNVFLTDGNTAPIDLRVVGDWRKVETLLRHLKGWTAESSAVLNAQEREDLAAAITAHERKTALAMNIIRMLDHVSQGQTSPESVSQVSELLEKAKRGSSGALDAVEARIETTLDDDKPSGSTRPIFLSSGQLLRALTQIQSYFEEEYRILLRLVAELAAKSVVHSGDLAPDRLKALKAAGFRGLGRILPISFNRILWVFLAVLAASFVLFVTRQWLASTGGMTERIELQRSLLLAGFISLTTAFAAIVGAAVGSTRRLAQNPSIPWRAFIAAGLFAVTLFFITHGTRIMMTSGIERVAAQQGGGPSQSVAAPTAAPSSATAAGEAASAAAPRMTPWVRPPSLVTSTPWSLIPFLVTLAICLLARLPGWPLVGGPIPKLPDPAAGSAAPSPAPTLIQQTPSALSPTARVVRMLAERVLDGVALGLAMALAVALVLKVVFPLAEAIVPASGIRLPARLAATMATQWLPWSMVGMQFATGFFIGALMLREVRRAGHSRVVLTPVKPLEPLALPRAAGRLPVPVPGPAQ